MQVIGGFAMLCLLLLICYMLVRVGLSCFGVHVKGDGTWDTWDNRLMGVGMFLLVVILIAMVFAPQ